MLRSLAAIVVVSALGAAPAAAAGVFGWYAGIYGGGATPNAVEFGYDQYAAGLVGPGAIETPTGYVNDGGVDPALFEFLNIGPEYYPFADLGTGVGIFARGTLQMLGNPLTGVVAGYGFGNGLRLEGDLSAASFSAGLYTMDSRTLQAVMGGIDKDGTWTWALLDEVEDDMLPPTEALEDATGFVYQTDVQFLLVNAFYDIPTGTSVTPYIGGGVGVARITSTLGDLCGCISGTQTRLAPAAQLGGGVRVAITEPVTLDVGYRYKVTGDQGFSISDPVFDGFGSYAASAVHASGLVGVHTVQAGLTFALP